MRITMVIIRFAPLGVFGLIAATVTRTGLDAVEPLALFFVTVLLALGALWLAHLFGIGKAFAYGVGPFIVTDLVKIAVAACIVPALWNVMRRLRPSSTDAR